MDARCIFGYGKPKSRSAHGPAPRYGPSKVSLTMEEISASLEGSLPRTLEAKAISDSLEGRPSGPLDARTDSASLEFPSAEPSTRPRRRSDLCLIRDHPRRTGAAAQPPDGTDAFTRQLLHSTGRESGGVRQRQLASATMLHSGYDRRLINLRPLLCRCSQYRAGLQSSVRACLTPPPLCCLLLVLFSLAGPSEAMGNDPRTQYEPRPKPGWHLQHPRRLTSSDVGFCALLQLSPRR